MKTAVVAENRETMSMETAGKVMQMKKLMGYCARH
jgi:hypothetical protein